MLEQYATYEAQGDAPFSLEIENKTGRAKLTRFAIFPGIQVGYIDAHINSFSCYGRPIPGAFAINHCEEGRVECAFSNGSYLYMGPGDMSVGWRRSVDYCHTVTFPSSHYHGLSIVFDTATCQPFVDELLGTNKVDLPNLCNRFCRDSDFGMIVQADDDLQTMFHELYSVPDALKCQHIRLKFSELLLYLNTLYIHSQKQEEGKVTLRQVAIVKAIHDALISDLRQHPTIVELAETYGIGQTSLKKAFRSVYGNSILQYIRAYRMEKAKKLLVRGDMPVGLVSLLVGYKNPSKFTDSFYRIVGCLPRNYRDYVLEEEANRFNS